MRGAAIQTQQNSINTAAYNGDVVICPRCALRHHQPVTMKHPEQTAAPFRFDSDGTIRSTSGIIVGRELERIESCNITPARHEAGGPRMARLRSGPSHA